MIQQNVSMTPGPWVADRTAVYNAEGARRFTCGLTRTAYASRDEMYANARAIAACPDLIEALHPELLEAIADEIDCFEHSARADSLRIIAREQRAALRKAGHEQT